MKPCAQTVNSVPGMIELSCIIFLLFHACFRHIDTPLRAPGSLDIVASAGPARRTVLYGYACSFDSDCYLILTCPMCCRPSLPLVRDTLLNPCLTECATWLPSDLRALTRRYLYRWEALSLFFFFFNRWACLGIMIVEIDSWSFTYETCCETIVACRPGPLVTALVAKAGDRWDCMSRLRSFAAT